jgi:hypothetical protein
MRRTLDSGGVMKDTNRLNWLEANEAFALINDDNGHWACVSDGMQNVPMSKQACDIQTTFFVEANRWHDDIREAIDFAMEENENSKKGLGA